MARVLLTVLALSLAGSVVALVLWELNKLIGDRLSKSWHYYLWLIVVVRFLLPVSLSLPIPSLPAVVTASLAQHQTMEAVSTPYTTAPEAIFPGQSSSTNDPVIPTTQQFLPATTELVLEYVCTLLGFLWLVVATIALLHSVMGYLRFVVLLHKSSCPVEDEQVLALYADVARELRLKWCPRLMNGAVPMPMLMGLLRPTLLLPVGQDTRSEILQYVLLHELTHFRRHDILIRWAAQLTACIHWFNPLAGLVKREIAKACEYSCDEAVLRNMDRSDRRAYGDMLLETLEAGMGSNRITAGGMCLSEDAETLKERLVHIMKEGGTPRRFTLPALLLTVVLAGCATIAMPDSPQGLLGGSSLQGSNLEAMSTLYADYDNMDVLRAEELDTGHYLYSNSYTTGTKQLIGAKELVVSGPSNVFAAEFLVDTTATLSCDAEVQEGMFKLVHITPDGNVTTLFESDAADKKAAVDVTFPEGVNIIRIVGRPAHIKRLTADWKDLNIYTYTTTENGVVPDNVQREYDVPGESPSLPDARKDGQVVAEVGGTYAKYEYYGLTFNKKDSHYYFDGKRVRYFEDKLLNGHGYSAMFVDYPYGEVDIHTTRIPNSGEGDLSAIVTYSTEDFRLRTLQWQARENTNADSSEPFRITRREDAPESLQLWLRDAEETDNIALENQNGRQYIYCNVRGTGTYQLDIYGDKTTIVIKDTDEGDLGFVLLSIPLTTDLDVQYKGGRNISQSMIR